MPEDFTITVAVAGDIHFHAPRSGAARIDQENSLRADVLVCPGDLANRVCSVGMMQAWDHLKEIERKLECQQLLTTLGNHDVDSRKEHSTLVYVGLSPQDVPVKIAGSRFR